MASIVADYGDIEYLKHKENNTIKKELLSL